MIDLREVEEVEDWKEEREGDEGGGEEEEESDDRCLVDVVNTTTEVEDWRVHRCVLKLHSYCRNSLY